ncbi:MAG: transposase, partial [Actinobacteria bacterium]|nr:transposase [Actinomycetota bacterium]
VGRGRPPEPRFRRSRDEWRQQLVGAAQDARGRRAGEKLVGTVEAFYQAHTGQPSGKGGAVTFQQLFGSSMAANLHFHSLRVDGVFTLDADGALVFHPAPPLSTEHVQTVVDEVRRRVVRLLRRRGLLDEADELLQHDDADDTDGQHVLLGASVAGRVALGLRAGKRPRALRGPPRPQRPLPPRCAVAAGFNLHADVRVAGSDRTARERLCRYIARPHSSPGADL